MARVGNANLLLEPNLQLIDKCGIIPLELIRPAAEMTLPASATKLGMISGHTLNVVGTYNAEVRLGSWSAAHRFLVADINTDTILGADFLARHGIDILYGEG